LGRALIHPKVASRSSVFLSILRHAPVDPRALTRSIFLDGFNHADPPSRFPSSRRATMKKGVLARGENEIRTSDGLEGLLLSISFNGRLQDLKQSIQDQPISLLKKIGEGFCSPQRFVI